jgi:hypothetical protein
MLRMTWTSRANRTGSRSRDACPGWSSAGLGSFGSGSVIARVVSASRSSTRAAFVLEDRDGRDPLFLCTRPGAVGRSAGVSRCSVRPPAAVLHRGAHARIGLAFALLGEEVGSINEHSLLGNRSRPQLRRSIALVAY